MLQFITKISDRYSVAEEARMAVEGGCRWIQLSAVSVEHNEGVLRDVAHSLVALCSENEAFMIIENDVDLVDELKVHGVFLRDSSRETVAEARERLGAHAVVGALCRSFEDVAALKGLDVDYVAVPVPDETISPASFYSGISVLMRNNAIDFHLVAMGDFPVGEMKNLLDAGCAGVAVSGAIADAEDPVAATRAILEVLIHD